MSHCVQGSTPGDCQLFHFFPPFSHQNFQLEARCSEHDEFINTVAEFINTALESLSSHHHS